MSTNDAKTLADRIMMGIVAHEHDGGTLEVLLAPHTVSFVKAPGQEGHPGYCISVPRHAFMLAAMTLAKEMETRVDDWCNDEPDSLNQLANEMLATHAEVAASYPLCVKGTDGKDGGTWMSEVALYGYSGMAAASCLDDAHALSDMLKLPLAARQSPNTGASA